jgi:hypothetical protein
MKTTMSKAAADLRAETAAAKKDWEAAKKRFSECDSARSEEDAWMEVEMARERYLNLANARA